MRKLYYMIAAALLLFGVASSAGVFHIPCGTAEAGVVISPVQAGGGDTYDDVIAFFTFENCGGSPCQADYTLSSDDYPSSGTLTRISAAEINSAAAFGGSYGLDSTTSNDIYYTTSVQLPSTSGVIAFAFYSYRASFNNYERLLFTSDGGTESVAIEFYSDDTVRVVWTDSGGAKNFANTSPGKLITTDAWFKLQITYDATTELMKIEVADDDDLGWTELVNTTGTAFAPISFTSINVGTYGSGEDLRIDNFAVSNSTDRDFFDNLTATTSPR